MSAKDTINIVNENDEVIGEATREVIHRQGLLHREVNVWFYTHQSEIIFQKRGANQETFSNLLDATAGGHVEIGDDYLKTAVKETLEETGINIDPEKLKLFFKIKTLDKDELTGKINNKFQAHYIYQYDGDFAKLNCSEGQGFELWDIDRLLNINNEDAKKFICSILKEPKFKVFKHIKSLLISANN